MSISDKLEKEIIKVEIEKTDPISLDKILEIISALKHLDQDLKPMLEIVARFMESSQDEKFRTLMLKKLLKFYGINNSDILTCRQKLILVDRQLVKTPFLKAKQKECINILLKDLNIL